MCFSDVTLGAHFHTIVAFCLVPFFSICYSQCNKHKNDFRIGLLGKAIPETPAMPSPDPSTPNLFIIQKSYITLLNIDLNKLVPLERPPDTIGLGNQPLLPTQSTNFEQSTGQEGDKGWFLTLFPDAYSFPVTLSTTPEQRTTSQWHLRSLGD